MDLESHGKILNLGWAQISQVKGRNLEPGNKKGKDWFKEVIRV